MVRFFDPSKSDPSLIFIRGIQSYFYDKKNQLSEEEIRQAIINFFKDSQYTKMFDEYKQKEVDFPKIIVRDNCHKRKFVLSPYQDYTYYKSSFNPQENEITLCSNFTYDLLDLKENLDRELIMAYDHNIMKKDLSDNETFASSQIRACRRQYDNLTELTDELKRPMTESCAKYLMKVRRFPLI